MVNRAPGIANEYVSLRDVVDHFFNEGAGSRPSRGIWTTPVANGTGRIPLPLDVFASKDAVVMIAAVPGISPDKLEITIDQNTVTISGEMQNVASSEEANEATWYLHELPYGAFQRAVTLPIEIDATRADATFEHGILRLHLPKAEAAKPKQIKVRVAERAIDTTSTPQD